MSRNRLIKKEFFRDPKVGALPPAARLLFISLWVQADDYGYGLCDPQLLKSEAFAYDVDITADDVDRWMLLLAEKKMVNLYTVEGQNYYFVVNFNKHQVVNRKSGFRYPEPAAKAKKAQRNQTRQRK